MLKDEVPFSVRLEHDTLKRLREAARRVDRSVGSLIRTIVREWLAGR